MAKAKKSKESPAGPGVPRYRRAGVCPACQSPLALLVNGDEGGRFGQATPALLASCTCAAVQFDAAGVTAAEAEDEDDDESGADDPLVLKA